MYEYRSKKNEHGITKIITALLFGMILSMIVLTYYAVSFQNFSITAQADEKKRELKWTICSIEEGTTVDASYLWPEEVGAEFTGVYRDGKRLSEDKMYTITAGNVYHFRGISDDSVLYTEVYVGYSRQSILSDDILSDSPWYSLLPSFIRSEIKDDGWEWEYGPEYGDRAYLDFDSRRIVIREDDPTAVLYAAGLYLDDKYGYSDYTAFIQEYEKFTDTFQDTGSLFASALEYYYTKSGELRSTCPDIYAVIEYALSDS